MTFTAPPPFQSAAAFPDLDAAAAWYRAWLFEAALPIWWRLGADHALGGFHDALDQTGQPARGIRRARVQCRQAYAYARAGADGWTGPWRAASDHGWDFFHGAFLRADGLYRTMVSPEGACLDDDVYLYDQAFALLALSARHAATPGDGVSQRQGLALLRAMEARRHSAGGYVESGDQPFQANCHMHLLEAALAWLEVGEPAFEPMARGIAELARDRFIDPQSGLLREFFDAQWRPADGEDGRLVEPGHQFEWALLLARWAALGGPDWTRPAANTLFEAGRRGLDPRRNVAVNALWDDLTLRDGEARLWPQTEYLKAALVLGREDHALAAASGLRRYLDTPVRGLWWDHQAPDGSFRPVAAPATSLYHILGACEALEVWAGR